MLSRSLALLAATAVWGTTFVTVKDALDDSDAFTFLALRFLAGGAVALLLGLRADWRGVLVPGLKLGALLFGGYALQTVGLASTTPSRSAFVTGVTVLFVPFVAWAFSGARPPARAFVAPLLALAGLQRLTGVQLGDALPPGDLLTLGCAVLYALHIFFLGRWGRGLPVLPLTAVQLFTVSALSAACLPLSAPRLEPSSGYWAAVLFTGIFASTVAIALQTWAQARLSATRAAVIYSLEPVFALALSVLLGREPMTAAGLLGGGLILAAVLVSEVPLASLRRGALPQARGGDAAP